VKKKLLYKAYKVGELVYFESFYYGAIILEVVSMADQFARILVGIPWFSSVRPHVDREMERLAYSSTLKRQRGWWMGLDEQPLPLPLYLKYKDEIRAAQQSFPPLVKS